jgi:UDP-N-acetylglucosamine:LPS N-acetylglucosamine transferase
VLPQEELTPDTLLDAIDKLYKDAHNLRRRMQRENAADAADTVARIIDNVSK